MAEPLEFQMDVQIKKLAQSLAQAEARVNKTATRLDADFRRTNARVSTGVAQSAAGFARLGQVTGAQRFVLQNTANQLGDIAVQLESGAAASRVFGQQLPQMLKVGGGSIINNGSVVSLVADPGMSPYAAAKHGVSGLTKGAALEYAKDNIRINVIAPAFVATPMTQVWLDDPVMAEAVKSFNAAGRVAVPDEIVGIVLLLASPMSSFMTGAVYPVDGGQTAH